jgi:hypothetical protein
MKQVECIALFSPEGKPKPMRIRYAEKEENKVIEITKVVTAEHNNLHESTWSFKCETIEEGRIIPFKLKFNIQKCTWYLIER